MTGTGDKKAIFSISGNLAFKAALTVLLLVSSLSMLVFGLSLYHAERVGVYSKSRAEIEEDRLNNIAIGLFHLAFYEHYSLDGREEHILATTANRVSETDFYYAIYAQDGQLLAGGKPDFDPAWQSELVIQHESDIYDEQEGQIHFTGQPFTVQGYLDGDGTSKDGFYWNEKELNYLYGWRNIFPWLAAGSLLLTAGLAALLAICAGRRTGQKDIVRRRFDQLPLDLFLAAAAFLLYYLLEVALDLLWNPVANYYYYSDYGLYYPLYSPYSHFASSALAGLAGLAAVVLILELTFVTVVVRLKTRTLLKETLVYRFIWRPLNCLGRQVRFLLSRLPLIWKSGLLVLGWILLDLYLTGNFRYWDGEDLVRLFGKLVLTGAFMFLTAGFSLVRQGTQQLAAGRLEHQIETRNLYGELKSHARDLNQIGLGLVDAVEERMKSERFKTELITNVSHDLKTPLTSIVNYVDLLRQHENDPGKVHEYLFVLERQSQKLKKLTEDLVEAAKASTGNLALELLPVDAGVFLAQLAGEYAARFDQAGLQLLVEQKEEEIYLLADGRQLWRVLDNLLDNSCKYSQTGTRVYLSLTALPDRVLIILKNISRAPLNISAEDLQERFVRGDESRSSEGSGLGLSIAKSLCELQGATLDLAIDGDLFKVTLTFPRSATGPSPTGQQ